MMAWLLPLNLILLTVAICWRWQMQPARAYFLAAVTFGSTLSLLTEALSFGYHLTPAAAQWTQGGILLALAGVLWRVAHHAPIRLRRGNLSAENLLSWALPGLVLSVTAYLGWVAPPNTVDAWTYHLARVVHWAQNHSVAPYPTHILRQIYQMPWAEETILWLRLLSGGDHWAAFVQWWALLSLFVVFPDFVRRLIPHANIVLARWSIAAIPMAILQASSTQNDLVVTFWVIGFVYALLLYRESGKSVWLVASALALGLALRTKGTAYLWLLPFGVWWLFLMLRNKAWRWVPIAAVLTGMLVAGPWYRNFIVFGHPLGSHNTRQFYIVDEFTVRGWLSNSIRQLASHATAGYPYIPHTALSLATPVEKGTLWVHQNLLHLDVSSPALTEAGHAFRVPNRKIPSEDEAGAFSVIALLLLATPLAWWKGNQVIRQYLVVFWASWSIFVGFIKWQPWITRLHLPWVTLGLPVVLWLLQKTVRQRKAAIGLVLLAVLTLVPRPLFQNVQRPLQGADSVTKISPEAVLFLPVRNLKKPYLQAIDTLNAIDCTQIGLFFTENSPEHLFWYLLAPEKPNLHMEHILVMNPTARFATTKPNFAPCAVLVLRSDFSAPPAWHILGQHYVQAFKNDNVSLFVYVKKEHK